MKLSTDERLQKLQDLANIPEETLESFTKRQLDSLCAGVIASPRNLVKAELIELILSVTEGTRLAAKAAQEALVIQQEQERLAQLEAAAKLHSETVSDKATAKGYRDILTLDQPEDIWKGLELLGRNEKTRDDLYSKCCSKASSYLLSFSISYASSTVKGYITTLVKYLGQKLANLENGLAKDNIKTAVGIFIKEVKTQFKPFYNALKEYDKDQVALKVDGMVEIDPTLLLAKAKSILEDERSTWKELAVALTIVTGRRMAEVMSSASFTIVDQNTLSFSGVVKKKSRGKHDVRSIPCLVDSNLVVSGMKQLEKSGQRLEVPDDVNIRYSTILSREVGRWQSECCPDVKVTYKSFRALYATICYELFAVQPKYQPKYFSEILGHMENDLTTAGSYQVFHLSSEFLGYT